MVKGILGDADIKGQMRVLTRLMENAFWHEFWDHLGLTVFTFGDFRLANTATDAKVWQTCQHNDLVLITGNRNRRGPSSLERTIQLHNKPHCLPVFTLADPIQVKRNRNFANRVVEKLLERLSEIESYRGTGRLYLP